MMSEISSGWPHMWPKSMAKGSSETLPMMTRSFTCGSNPSRAVLGIELNGHRRGLPDVPVVFEDGAVGREFAHAGDVENGLALPLVVIAVEVGDLLLAGDV